MPWLDLESELEEMFAELGTLERADFSRMHVISVEEEEPKEKVCPCGRKFFAKTKQLRCGPKCRLNVRANDRELRIAGKRKERRLAMEREGQLPMMDLGLGEVSK